MENINRQIFRIAFMSIYPLGVRIRLHGLLRENRACIFTCPLTNAQIDILEESDLVLRVSGRRDRDGSLCSEYREFLNLLCEI